MTTAPSIIVGNVHDALANMPSASVDAVVALVPVNSVNRKPGRHGPPRPINPTDLDVITRNFIRVCRGATALVVIHGAPEWAGSFTRHGLTVAQESYSGAVDVIVGSAAPVTLPPADTRLMRPLIEHLIEATTKPGDTILDAYASPVVALAIQATGRGLLAITRSKLDARNLSNTLTASRGISFTAQEQAEVFRRLAQGESQTSIARSMGTRQSNIANLRKRNRRTEAA